MSIPLQIFDTAICCGSVDANTVVGEGEVRHWTGLLHVARETVLSLCAVAECSRLDWLGMTGQAFLGVECVVVAAGIVVRIVASVTGEVFAVSEAAARPH